jgi:hypothetical protein
MKNMKKILMIIAVIVTLAAITYSCRQESKQDGLNTSSNDTESNIVKTFREAKLNDDLVKQHFDLNGQYLSPMIFMEDSLYHMNDSLCNAYYLTYCKEMMEGDSMMGGGMMGGGMMGDGGMMGGGMMGGDTMGGGLMGGGMMGGDTMHGCGMMNMQSCMSDTASVNQVYRELISIRQAHSSHHPVKQ